MAIQMSHSMRQVVGQFRVLHRQFRNSSSLTHKTSTHIDSAFTDFCCLLNGFPSRCGTCPFPKDFEDVLKNNFGSHGQHKTKGRNTRSWSPPHKYSSAKRGESLIMLGFSVEDKPTKAELKRAFRKAALLVHPDVSSDGGNGEEFRAILEAFELLTKDCD